MDNALQDKVAIVTGASSGIGRAMAITLAARGCRIVAAARNEAPLLEVTQEIGAHALAVPTDISDRKAVDHMIQSAVSRFDGVDIVFANAGLFSQTEFTEIDENVIDSLIDVNLRGVMHSVHASLPHLRARGGGDILIVGSIAGITELPLQAVYGPTKHALQSFAHILRRQLRKDNIRVGMICPGTVATPLWGEREAEVQSQVDLRKAIRAEDVIAAAMFMLEQPRHVAIRDVVILPQGQDI